MISGAESLLSSITILILPLEDSSLISVIPSTFFSWPGAGFSFTSSTILSIKAVLFTAYGISVIMICFLPLSCSTISHLALTLQEDFLHRILVFQPYSLERSLKLLS